MSSGLTLLILAMQLLTAIVNAPNLPQSFRDSAVQVAQVAITESNRQFALESAGGASTSTTIVVPTITPAIIQQVVNTPSISYAGIIPVSGTIPVPQNIPMPTQDLSAITVEFAPGFVQGGYVDALNNVPHGSYFLRARILDRDGKTTAVPSGTKPSQPISMTISGVQIVGAATQNRTIDVTDGFRDWYTVFEIDPLATGTAQAIFTSGDLTKEFDFDVKDVK